MPALQVNRPLPVIVLALLLLHGSSHLRAQVLPDFTALVENNAAAIVNVNSFQRSSDSDGENERLDEILRYYFGDRLPDIPEERLREFEQRPSLGSGFIVSEDGYIITNHHVVQDADEITITLNDRREFAARLIGSDASSDLALLKIDAQGLSPVILGDSSQLRVGEWVLAIGSPMGLRFSVAAGIISYMGRNIPNGSGGNYVSFIQTDVAINPGNSGGPLFNLAGEVVGINSQIFTSTGGSMGLSFAIPVDVAKNVIGQLTAKGVVERGWMGVGISEISQEMADEAGLKSPSGALVTQVIQGSPAEHAGFLAGDIITHFNGREIVSSGDLPYNVGLTAPESEARVDVIRAGDPLTIAMTVGKLASAGLSRETGQGSNTELGLVVTDAVRENGLSGVMVIRVDGDIGGQAGFQAGDILLSIDGVETTDVDTLNALVPDLGRERPLPALVERDGVQSYLTLRLPE